MTKHHVIYQIRNLINSKIYVGSAIEKSNRWNVHVSALRASKHHNRYLQSAWNKYGEINFLFEVLELVFDRNKLLEAEQYWIDRTNCSNRRLGYNLSPTAGSPLGLKHSEEAKVANAERSKGRVQSEETKLKRSLALKGRKLSEENKRKIGEANKGKSVVMSEERLEKISAANKSRVRSPETLEKLRQLMIGNSRSKGLKQSPEMIAKRFSPEAKENMRLGALKRHAKRRVS